jgi:histidinol-phosphate phosphatase family protein
VRPAAFLDRDGTLVDDPGFLRDPAQVRLLPGVCGALVELASLGVARVVISNQSGIGRGLVTEEQLHAVNDEIARQLGLGGATIDAWYHCPHLPEEGCGCRKPGTDLHRAAARQLGIDLARSWCIGDRIGDVAAARALGASGILVRTGEGESHLGAAREAGVPVADDLAAAVQVIRARLTP